MVAVEPETEQVLGVAMWMPPGKGMDFPVTTLIKCGAVQAVLAWGPGALKRIFADFVPRSEEAKARAFTARGKDTKDCWYLLQFAVDPSAQGRGVGSLLMADGIARAGRRPLHLEASSPKSRDIYLHFGCVLDEEVIIGQGAVDAKGVVPKSYADATGYPLYVMTKVRGGPSQNTFHQP
ncbi:hypothetical protein CYLTODRAFT_350315 [Cylindrobasidium torrendii FP15055 ss-10]|uniref:N-acetyltransferase domain-containing protein n=1 Tax=Cylindrobasidium torrendii FP15055 ss-10 TaxID=1314674 RepID=A0A0D7BEU8_9AGAR|nr:hypothetical protein CYLTODRAFT_350315 [Cylindrobasidium torrendii FP15055 ss-10]